MFQYLNIAKYNLKISLFPHIFFGVALILLTPVIFGTTSLDSTAIMLPLEIFVPFVGVILLTPVFQAENEAVIFDTVTAKSVPYTSVCLVRIIMSLLTMLFLIIGFAIYLNIMESDVLLSHIFACYSNAIFLGGLGILASSLSGNVVIGYIAPMLYYILDFMGGFAPFKLTLFSGIRGMNNYGEVKIILFISGIVFIISALLAKRLILKKP